MTTQASTAARPEAAALTQPPKPELILTQFYGMDIAVEPFEMDYDELRKAFPPYRQVYFVGKSILGGKTWGQVFTVTGYSPILPSLVISGLQITQRPSDFHLLSDAELCVHKTHIQGGDCPDCAEEKRREVIDSCQPYSLAEDPMYQRLLAEAQSKNFRPRIAEVLREVEGSGIRPYANKEASLRYAKAISGVDCVVCGAYVANYAELESVGIVSLKDALQSIESHFGPATAQKDYELHGYRSRSWVWYLESGTAVQLLFWSDKKPIGIRLYNSTEEELYY